MKRMGLAEHGLQERELCYDFSSFEFMSQKKIMSRAALSHSSRSAPVKPVMECHCNVASDDRSFEILRLTHTQNLAF